MTLSPSLATHPAAGAVPHSAGTGAPGVAVPALACDGHLHVYDPRFAYAPGAALRPPPATVADYRQLQRRLGTRRAVVVQPSSYGTDNACTLDAVAQLGASARAVVVTALDVPDAELARLHARGARGLRINALRGGAALDCDALDRLAPRLTALGWHLQLHVAADSLPALAPWLQRLPVPLVFDHIGRVPQPAGVAHPGLAVLQRLLDGGRAWVKLSAPYLDSRDGSPDHADVGAVVRALVRTAPERLVWGSDWPHPAATAGERALPDDAHLLDHLSAWVGDAALWQRILVDNPAQLYGF